MMDDKMVEMIIQTDTRSKRNEQEIVVLKKAYDSLVEIASGVKYLVKTQEELRTEFAKNNNKLEGKIDSVNAKVSALEQKPGRRWESVVEKALLVLVAAIVGYFLSHLGINI